MAKTKNIIILVIIAAVLILVYVFFIRTSSDTAALISSSSGSAVSNVTEDGNSSINRDFLTLLLSVKNIKLDDAIFSDEAFNSLRDSSIILTPSGNEGRPNPFAPLGTDIITSAPEAVVPMPTDNTNAGSSTNADISAGADAGVSAKTNVETPLIP